MEITDDLLCMHKRKEEDANSTERIINEKIKEFVDRSFDEPTHILLGEFSAKKVLEMINSKADAMFHTVHGIEYNSEYGKVTFVVTHDHKRMTVVSDGSK